MEDKQINKFKLYGPNSSNDNDGVPLFLVMRWFSALIALFIAFSITVLRDLHDGSHEKIYICVQGAVTTIRTILASERERAQPDDGNLIRHALGFSEGI